MPQMSPILWLNLYVMFTLTLIIFISMFFYTKMPVSPAKPLSTLAKETFNWKW